MAETRESAVAGGDEHGVRITGIVEAVGWFVLEQEEDDGTDRWRREPLACWALVADGSSSYVVGLSASGLDVVELCAHPARYVHCSSFPGCSCRFPVVLGADPFCATCAGTVDLPMARSA